MRAGSYDLKPTLGILIVNIEDLWLTDPALDPAFYVSDLQVGN